MSENKVIITQSNYIPWKGYFDNIQQADIFVVYDDMQYTRRDWRNRNYIKTPQGLKWITIPVKVSGKYYQKINETVISDQNWVNDHLNQLRQNYNKSACYNETISWIENLYHEVLKKEYLTDINTYLLQEICRFLNIKTRIIDSRQFIMQTDKTDRLVEICKSLNATEYLTGPAAKSYMDESKFEKENIKLTYFNYEGYPEYPQLYPPFEHGVTILDVIFNCGTSSRNYINRIK